LAAPSFAELASVFVSHVWVGIGTSRRRRSCSSPIGAFYSFSGFPDQTNCHQFFHHDGYPTGAAWRFAEALRESPESASFLAAFLSTQQQADPLASPEQAADAEYRYRVQLDPCATPHLQVKCWRRIPAGDSWIPRCGPMPLAAFIQRFLPGDQL
jgi:hypothetical protein